MTQPSSHPFRYLGITAISGLLTLTALTGGWATDATLLPNAIQYFMDANGKPLSNGKVFMYVPTTTTPKTTWTTADKAVAQPQPFIPLGIAGKPASPIYGDGSYRQLVKDQFNNTIWDFNTASTGAGGSTPVVPTVGDGLFVGSIIPWSGLSAPTNYVFAYGQAISRTAFPLFASTVTISTNLICTSGLNVLSGIADTSQIHIGTPVEVACVPPGTTVINVAANSVTVSSNATTSTGLAAKFFPFGNGDGSTTLNVPDLRGRVLAGRNNMGGTASSNLTSAFFGSQGPNAQGSAGGSQIHNLTANENGPHNHDVFFIDPGHTHGTTAAGGGAALFAAGGTQAFASGSFATSSVTNGFTINSALTGGSVASAASGGTANITAFSGSGQSFSVVQPTTMMNYVIKVLPDNSTVVSSGVASLGGMVGDITCGANVVCGSQTISVSTPSATADTVVYTAPFTGSVAQSQSNYNSKRISITDFGCVGDSGVTDNGPCLRAAYDAAAVIGGSIYIPPVNGWYGVSTCRNDGVFDGTSLTVANGNKSVSIFGGGWNKKPFATPQGSWLLPNSSFPSTCSWINLAGSDEVTGAVYRDFAIGEFGGAYGTPKGLHGLFVNSANPAFCLDNATVDHVFIANMAVGYSIRIAGANGCGGIANSRILNSSLMNINATFLGDSVQFIGNTTGGNATIDSRNVGLDFFNCDGCTSTIAAHNNFLNFNGKIIARGASKPVFRDNEGEQQVGTTNTDGCLIDLKGDHAAVENATVTGNKLTQNSTVGSYKPVCVGNATQAQIYDNAMVLAAAVPYDYVTVNAGTAQGTYVGINRCAYNGTTIDFTCAISTLGVAGRQDTPYGFTLAGTTSQTVIKTTGTGNGTIQIPTATSPALDTFALLGAAQAFLSKSLVSSTNTLGGVTMGLGSDATGDIYYRNSGGVLTRLPIGSSSNILTVSGGLPSWAAVPPAGLVIGTSTVTGGSTATNDLFFNNASVVGRIATGNNAALVTNGSGVWSASTTLPNMALGTPTSVNLANGTGLPIGTGLNNAGTGILAAMGVNVGTAGSLVVNGGALGTPSSGVATNLTGTASGLTAGSATTATTATNATNGATVATTTNASFFPLFAASSTNSNQPFNLDTTFTYNPSTDTLTATNFAGNATTASAVAASALTGATLAAGVTGSSLTSVGTLTGGATGAGFTVALGTSTITGTLPCANHPALTGAITASSGGCATLLGSFSSANLAGALTDETGTGVAVFGTSPTFTTSHISPLHIGGAAAGSTAEIRSTSGTGSGDLVSITGGTNGATRIATFLGTGLSGFGSAAGAANPTNTINVISANATTQDGAVTSYATLQHLVGNNSTNPSLTMDAFGGTAAIHIRAAGGTAASKTASIADSATFVLSGDPYDGSIYSQQIGIFGRAAQNFTGSNKGTYLQLLTTPNNSTTITEAVRVQNSGGVSIGTTTDPGLGGLQVNGQSFFPNAAADTATVDSTACLATTGGKLLKGTGTLGICLGTSSARFKHDIAPMGAGLAEIVRLAPKNFFYNKDSGDGGKRQQYGLIAEEVVMVLPGITSPDREGKPQAVDLLALVPVLVNAMKQLKADNDNLRMDVLALQAKVGVLKGK